MTPDAVDLWKGMEAELRRAVPGETFDIWLAPLAPQQVDEDALVLTAPDELHQWVEQRFGRLLRATADRALPVGLGIRLVPQSSAGSAADRRAGAPRPPAQDAGIALNPKLTFEQFVIGDTNRFAHAAALAVAELPAQAYNPLFIYGPPGVGKTHLLHSIANYVHLYGNGMTVRLTSVERFTNDFVAAVQRNDVDRFKGVYRHNDVLLIDDVQYLASKARTEEEFFHTFNALHDAGSQLVLTSDRLPRDLGALEDRLRERFEAGLVTDIRPPDRPTRLAILRKRVQHDGLDLDPEVIDVIADRITANIRALEGALIRVVAFASLTGRDISPDLAEQVIAGLYPAARRQEPPSIERIQAMVCERFGISREELVGGARTSRVVWPRQVAMYLAREHAGASLPAIAAAFGGRNHTTVLHAVRRTTARLAGDPEAQAAVQGLAGDLAAPPA